MTKIQQITAKILNVGKSFSGKASKNPKTISTKIAKIISDLENSKTGSEAVDYIINACEKGQIEQINGNFFTKDNYFIKNLFERDGLLYSNNLERFDSFNLGILPMHIKTVIKNGDAFIIGKYKCAEGSKIVPYFEVFREIPKEQKTAAFKDIQTLVKKGYTSPDILKYPEAWKVSMSDKKILLDPAISIRPVEKGENKAILNEIYNIIFHK